MPLLFKQRIHEFGGVEIAQVLLCFPDADHQDGDVQQVAPRKPETIATGLSE